MIIAECVHNKSRSRHVLGNLYHGFMVHQCMQLLLIRQPVVVAFIRQLALVTSGLCSHIYRCQIGHILIIIVIGFYSSIQ